MTSPALVQAHRLVALGLGALVVLVTLAGAALVFRDELTPVFTPRIVVSPREAPPDAYERMLDAARRIAPGASGFDIVPARRGDRAAEVIVRTPGGRRHLFFDPHDARLVADSERHWMPFATLFELHRELLAGEGGATVVGIAGFALAFLALSGIVLWWPRAWKYAFRLRLRGNRVAVSFDLHRTAGALFALLLLFNALSGAAMVFDEAAPRLVNRLSGRPDVARVGAAPAAGAMRPLDELVAAANHAFAEGQVSRIQVRDGAPVVVRKRLAREHDTNGMNRIYVDATTGRVLEVSTLAALPPGNAMYEWLYPIHTGKLFGDSYRAVVMVAGVVPLVSLATGLILWLSKRRRKAASEGSLRRARAAAD